jgi:hypothetical protein
MRNLAATLALISCLPAAAAALVIEFGGNVCGLIDPGGRLDESVANCTPGSPGIPGTRVTGTYEVDPTPLVGGLPGEVGAARLVFQIGNYTFDATQNPHAITLQNDLGPVPVDIWSTRQFVLPELDPAIPQELNGAGYGAGLQLFDGIAHTQITGNETEPFVVTDLTGWNIKRLYLNALVADGTGGTAIGSLQIQVDLDSWQVTPEPCTGALLALGLLFIARGAHRQNRFGKSGTMMPR